MEKKGSELRGIFERAGQSFNSWFITTLMLYFYLNKHFLE